MSARVCCWLLNNVSGIMDSMARQTSRLVVEMEE